MSNNTEAEKSRNQGQLEGMLAALRIVRQTLDGGAPQGHAEPAIDAELKEINKRISALREK